MWLIFNLTQNDLIGSKEIYSWFELMLGMAWTRASEVAQPGILADPRVLRWFGLVNMAGHAKPWCHVPCYPSVIHSNGFLSSEVHCSIWNLVGEKRVSWLSKKSEQIQRNNDIFHSVLLICVIFTFYYHLLLLITAFCSCLQNYFQRSVFIKLFLCFFSLFTAYLSSLIFFCLCSD